MSLLLARSDLLFTPTPTRSTIASTETCDLSNIRDNLTENQLRIFLINYEPISTRCCKEHEIKNWLIWLLSVSCEKVSKTWQVLEFRAGNGAFFILAWIIRDGRVRHDRKRDLYVHLTKDSDNLNAESVKQIGTLSTCACGFGTGNICAWKCHNVRTFYEKKYPYVLYT